MYFPKRFDNIFRGALSMPMMFTVSSVLNIVPIPKSGDLSLRGNYRGISLSFIVTKTYKRLILNRIRPALDSHLRTNQN